MAEKVGNPCNCENSACTDHYNPPLRPGPCQRPANPAKVAQYVGPLCDECAALMPAEYMVKS